MWWHTQSKHREELNINEKLSAYQNGLPSNNTLKRIVGTQSLEECVITLINNQLKFRRNKYAIYALNTERMV